MNGSYGLQMYRFYFKPHKLQTVNSVYNRFQTATIPLPQRKGNGDIRSEILC